MKHRNEVNPALRRLLDRRRFIQNAAAGTLVAFIGGCGYKLGSDAQTDAAKQAVRPDGRPKLPPNQRVLTALRPMGGIEGDPDPAGFQLKIHGAVKKVVTLDFAGLLKLPRVEQTCDVHCVTGWSMLDGVWSGVQLQELADLAGVKSTARHVIFEANAGYTANVPIEEALVPSVLVTHRLNGDPLEQTHGAPVRALVPDLYFWKSAKWLTGIRFETEDEPGYWETRGYNNHADPWREERYA